MKIYIIRHGETKANKEGLIQGQSEFDINELGVMLAEVTGREMKDIKFDDRIKEINMGEFELKKFRPGEAEIPIDWSMQFLDNPLKMEKAPGGESAEEVIARTEEFSREMARECYADCSSSRVYYAA